MQTTEAKGSQLVRPGPIGLGIRVLLGATTLYWFADPCRPHHAGAVAGRRCAMRAGRSSPR
jgi:hypothetical protein